MMSNPMIGCPEINGASTSGWRQQAGTNVNEVPQGKIESSWKPAGPDEVGLP